MQASADGVSTVHGLQNPLGLRGGFKRVESILSPRWDRARAGGMHPASATLAGSPTLLLLRRGNENTANSNSDFLVLTQRSEANVVCQLCMMTERRRTS